MPEPDGSSVDGSRFAPTGNLATLVSDIQQTKLPVDQPQLALAAWADLFVRAETMGVSPDVVSALSNVSKSQIRTDDGIATTALGTLGSSAPAFGVSPERQSTSSAFQDDAK